MRRRTSIDHHHCTGGCLTGRSATQPAYDEGEPADESPLGEIVWRRDLSASWYGPLPSGGRVDGGKFKSFRVFAVFFKFGDSFFQGLKHALWGPMRIDITEWLTWRWAQDEQLILLGRWGWFYTFLCGHCIEGPWKYLSDPEWKNRDQVPNGMGMLATKTRNGTRPPKQQVRFNLNDEFGTSSPLAATHAEHALLAPNTICKDFIFGNEDRKWATRCRPSVRKDPENCPVWHRGPHLGWFDGLQIRLSRRTKFQFRSQQFILHTYTYLFYLFWK